MVTNRPNALSRITFVLIALLLGTMQGFAQSDSDPNSPTPVLLNPEGSKRVLAIPAWKYDGGDPSDLAAEVFRPGSEVVFFVRNIELMKGEEANAFRVNVSDARGRNYRFNVLDISPVNAKGFDGVYALKVRLTDSLGFWSEPMNEGDVHVSVAWRGLASEKLRLGYGATGGNLKDVEVAEKSSSHEPTNELVLGRFAGDRMRFFQQAGFGPNTALDDRVRRIGIRTYLNEQLDAAYPSTGNPYPDIPLKSTDTQNTLGCGPAPVPRTPEYDACIRDHYTMYPIQRWFFTDALYGETQLRHKASWALSQIWVISGSGGVTQQSSWMIAYHKKLSQHAFGNYRDLMRDMTLNPGMGNYLDMARSTRTNPNENYPREILQLFTVGLFMLNQDGTLVLDGQGNPIPTYDQTDVDNFTKVLTGWSLCNVGCPNSLPSIPNYKDPMIVANANNHDITAKTLLDYPGAPNPTIPACTGCTGTNTINYANLSLDQTLNNIFNHPNVGPFVSKLLIQHMVTSDPTPAYVGRVAAKFNNNGAGVRGDMKSVIRAILLDHEARGDIKTDPNFGKLREPVQFATNILRALNVKNVALNGPSDGVITNYTNGIGQNPFNSPTVFNYYSPDFMIPGTALLGPEFGIMTTGTAVGRANVVNTMTFGQIGTGANTPSGTRIDLDELTALATADPTGNRVLDALNHKMLHGTMSPQMRAIILPAFTAVSAATPAARAQAAVYLVATSSQFQVQR